MRGCKLGMKVGNGAINGKAIRPFSSSPSSSSLRHLLSSSTSTSFLLSLSPLLLLSLFSKISPYFCLVRAFSFPFNPSMAAGKGTQSISAAKGNALLVGGGSPFSRDGGGSCCKIIQKRAKSLEESSSGGIRRWEGARGGVDGGEGAGCPRDAARDASSKVGSEGSLSPAVLGLITLLVLPFLCFFYVKCTRQQKARGGCRPSSYPHSEIPPSLCSGLGTAGKHQPKTQPFCSPSSLRFRASCSPHGGGDTHGTRSSGSPGVRGESWQAKGGEWGAAPWCGQPSPAERSGPNPPPGTPADGRLVWGPGDLPWFLQLLLTHFCSSCSHSPQRVPHPTAPQTPEGCRCGHQQGLYFGEGGEGKQLLGRQHPPATWKPQFPWKPFFAPIILPLPHPLICL